MKNRIIIIVLVILGTIAAIFFSNYTRSKDNGFERTVFYPGIQVRQVIDLSEKSFRLMNNVKTESCLFNYKKPFSRYTIDFSIGRLISTDVTVPEGFNAKSSYIKLDATNENLIISNAEGNLILSNNKHSKFYQLPIIYSDQALAVSSSAIAVRSLQKIGFNWDMRLVKVNLADRSVESYNLPLQKDGLFANDGQFKYDKTTSRFFYTFSYSGEFLCLDTSMKLIFRSKTIDTVKAANIRLGTLRTRLGNGREATQITQLNPAPFVNKAFTINRNRLFIHSAIKSKDDPINHEPIDIYSINDGSYIKSFYLPKYKGNRVEDFIINERGLLAIQGNWLVIYAFNDI